MTPNSIDKKHDWIIANMNNPTFDIGDFQNIMDMNLSNTQLLEKDKYLNSQKIKNNPLFQDESGNFSEKKFNDFYNKASNSFKIFSNESVVDNYEYGLWDVTRPKNAKTKNIQFSLDTITNPRHISVGIGGINAFRESEKSMRELAQGSKIYDPATGKFLEETVNDISLFENPIEYFKSLGDDPLVYATYDEDTTEIDPQTGKLIKHVKGEWKVNEDGEYYTEKLNGRSLIGKEVVSSLDYLTSENSQINKYDFFDSDDVKKSIGGTIAKGIASVIPLFIPYVDVAYGGYLVAREMGKSLPMLYGIFTGLTGQEKTDSKLLNTIAAYGQKFTSSTSDYAKNNVFSFENFANLLTDVATQWQQQSFVAQGFSNLIGGGQKALKVAQAKAFNNYASNMERVYVGYKTMGISEKELLSFTGAKTLSEVESLRKAIRSGDFSNALLKDWNKTPFGKAAWEQFVPKAQKIAENRVKMGQNMSLAYMAVISNTDVYDSVLQKGGTPFEAAAIALGSTLGMYAVDKWAGLGEMFFQNEPARKTIRTAAINSADEIKTGMQLTKQVVDSKSRSGLIGLIEKGISSGKKAVEKLDVNKLKSMGMVGKSLGEGLEEVSEELVTDLSKTLGEIAGTFGVFSQDDYGAWDNAFERYTMSFLGGMAGGAIYGAKQEWQTRNDNDEFPSELTYLLRNGFKKDILKEIKSLRDKGKLGSTDLSMNVDENGTYLTAKSEEDSQNQKIYEALVKSINQLDLILNDNNLNLSDDALFDNMVQGEVRSRLLSDFLKDENAKEVSYITKYYQDFNNLADNILKVQQRIDEHFNSVQDNSQKNNPEFQNKLQKLEKEKEELLKQKEDLFGENSLGYVDKLLFILDSQLSNKFIDISFDQFVRSKNKNPFTLTESEKKFYQEEYDKYTKTQKEDLDIAYNLYKQMEGLIFPEISKYKDFDIKTYSDMMEKWKNFQMEYKFISPDLKLDEESDEEYNNRNTQLEGESEKDFKQRKLNRDFNVRKTILQKRLKAIQNLDNIDSNMQRQLQLMLEQTRSDLENTIIGMLFQNGKYSAKAKQDITKAYKNYIKTKDSKKLQSDIFNIIYKESYNTQLNLDEDNINDSYINLSDSISFSVNSDNGLKGIISEDIIVWYNNLKPLVASYLSQQTASNIDESKIGIEDVFNFLESQDDIWRDSDQTTVQHFKDKITNVVGAYLNESLGVIEDVYNSKALIFRTFDDNNDPNVFMPNVNTNKLDNQFGELKQFIDTDEALQLQEEVENKIITSNPIIPFINFISNVIRGDKTSLENILTELNTKYKELETISDFELSSVEYDILKKILKDMDLAKGFIYGASNTPSYSGVIGHNKSLNQFVKNHLDVFKNIEELPELDSELANYLTNEIIQYQNTIKNYIEIHEKNKENREKRFEKAEENLIKTQLDFFNTNKDALSNLLEGSDSISDDGLLKLLKIQSLINYNYKKLLASGKSHYEILDSIFKSDNSLINFEGVIKQNTQKLDEKYNESQLTDYDKFQLIVTTLASKPSNYYDNLINYIKSNEKIGPIAIQEHVARVQYAQQEDPELINAALQWFKDKTKSKFDILWNTTVLTGTAGSGKSSAVSAVSTLDGDNTWVTGPTKDQGDNIHNNLSKSKVVKIEDLVYLALGEEQGESFLNHIGLQKKDKDGNPEKTKQGRPMWDTGGFFEVVERENENPTSVLTIDDNQILVTDNVPKHIIVDEATHIPTVTLSLISKWARKNNINLQYLGDSNQNGHKIEYQMFNFNPDQVIAWRTPKLSISLRDNNTQKQDNLNILNNLIDPFNEANTPTTAVQTYQKTLDIIKDLSLGYYSEKNNFRGEIISENIPDDFINSISDQDTVAIISNDPNSQYLKTLRDAGKDPIVINPLKVQGKEYDYVVIDTNVFPEARTSTDHSKAIAFYNGLKNLYTLISRSRKASVITDINVENIIKNRQDYITGDFKISNLVERSRNKRIGILQESLEKLKEWENTFAPIIEPIQEIDDTPEVNEKPIPEVNNEPETTPEETPAESQTEPEIIKDPIVTPKELSDATKDDQITKSNEEYRNEEKDIVDEENIESIVKFLSNQDVTARVYGNASFSGIDTSLDTWSNTEESTTDLGIFLSQGETVSTTEDKYELVKKLYNLKSLFLFGGEDFKLLNTDSLDFYTKAGIEDKFSLKAIRNAEYFISIEDNSINNRLIGLTTLKEDEDLKLIGEGNKVVKVIVKIKGKDDKIYTVSLGALANPKTWEKNKEKIINILNKKIVNSTVEDTKKQLRQYRDSLDESIKNYKNKIDEITRNNQLISINKPQFSSMTDLVKIPKMRIEDINSRQSTRNLETKFYHSKWDMHTQYAVTSEIYVETESHKGMNDKIIGKPVIYVSSCPFLLPSQLRSMYFQQKADPDNTVPLVRQVVLDHMGISINSLVDFKYTDIYQRQVGDVKFQFPFESKRVTPQMYLSMWNFRANLINYLNHYNNFLNSVIGKEFKNESEIKLTLIQDNKWYNQYKDKLKNESPTETGYRAWARVNQTETDLEKIEKIWKFNDDLSRANVKQFRLGYESKHGGYLRKISNVSKDDIYSDPTNVVGVYIYPNTAQRYLNIIDQMFTDVFDHIITPPKGFKKIQNISHNLNADNENWYKSLADSVDRGITLSSSDGAKSKFEADGTALTGFPAITIQLMRILKWKAFSDPEDSFYKLTYKKSDTESVNLDWTKIGIKDEIVIFEDVNNTTIDLSKYQIEGVYASKDGLFYNHIYEDMFSLMFHGLYSTKKPNDFEGDDIRATDAFFKFGIKTDSALAEIKNEGKTNLVSTSRRLHGTDVVPGLPQFSIDFSPKEVIQEENIVIEEETIESKFTESELTKIDSIQQDIIKLGYKLTDNEFKRLKSETLDTQLKDILKKKYKNYYNKCSKGKLDTLEYILDDNGNLITIEDTIQSQYGEISQKYIDNGVLKFDLISGDTVSVIEINGNLKLNVAKIQPVQTIVNEDITFELVRSKFEELLATLVSNDIKNSNDWKDFLQNEISPVIKYFNNLSGNLDDNSKLIITNKFKSLIDSALDYSDDIQDIISIIAQNIDKTMNPPKCII